MNNLFTLAPSETTSGSLYFLNSIFGTVGNVLVGQGPALLGSMFQVFNTSVLALGSLIVTYTTVVSILQTAHEGETLGKRFHTLWIPARTVMGIAALIPTAGGYSYLQIALMWFIIQGVGAADTLWTSTVNYVKSGQTTVPQSIGASANNDLIQKMGILFQGLVCQSAAKASYSEGYFCSDHAGDSFCKATDTLSIASGASQVRDGIYYLGPASACGNLSLGDSGTPIGQAQNQALAQIVSTLGYLADQFVAVDYSFNTFLHSNPLNPSVPGWISAYCADQKPPLSGVQCNPSAISYQPPTTSNLQKGTITDFYWKYGLATIAGGNFLATASSLYTGIVGAAVAQQASAAASQQLVQQWSQIIPSNLAEALLAQADAWVTPAINNGWIYAGSFFYRIAQYNSRVASVQSITVDPPDIRNLNESTGQVLTNAASTLVSYITSDPGLNPQATTTLQNVNSQDMCKSIGVLSSFCSSIVNDWITMLSGSTTGSLASNPIVAAQKSGDSLLNTLIVIVSVFLGTQFVAGLAGGIYFGTSPFLAAVISLGQTLVPLTMFFLLILLGVGLTLAVYTPMIPYMLFTFGAINWLIATVETMIAAPIVAIGLLHPEGGNEIWGKAEKALELLLNIFLRPSLMIFGMIGGMLMSFAVVTMINYAFLSVVLMVSPSSNVLEIIFFMVLYTSLLTTAINKSFDLIHLVPDNIMRWIGGGREQFGEGGGLEKVNQAFSGGVQKAESGIGSGVSGSYSASAGATKTFHDVAERNAKKNAAVNTPM